MPSVDQQVAEAKQRIATAQSAAARAEHERDVAAGQVLAVTSQLQSQFGVTPEQAPGLLAQLEADLAAEAAAVTQALDRAGL